MLEPIISFSSLYWIAYFLWNCSQISSNSSNVVFSKKIPRNLQKNVCEHLDITETNNWIRLLIFDDNNSVLFSQAVPKQLISLL